MILADGARHNFIKPRQLKQIEGSADSIYFSMIGMNRGHKHFYHFFEYYFQALFYFLHHVYNDSQQLVIVTRDELGAVQKELYAAIHKRYPRITFMAISSDQALYCPHAYVWENETVGKKGVFISAAYMAFLNEILLDYYQTPTLTTLPKRIYLSRKHTKLRHILNEDELMPHLIRHGFEVVAPEQMSFKEQFSLFHHAEMIVAIHGAALTNLMFCKPGTNVLELASAGYGSNDFLWMSAVRKLNHDILIGDQEIKHQHFRLDAESFRERLDRFVLHETVSNSNT
ncbi:MAG: glycosyltransferase family 61 protein [Alphaproteobacteria bacterium]|nr:glycosyltransferase family 61 protein [Alphaproteobacteria bacterium]